MLLVNARVGPSLIHGLGLIAQEYIPAGTTIWRFTLGFDIEIPEAALESMPVAARSQIRHYAEYLPSERTFVLSSDDDRFTNHADVPNTVSDRGHMVAICDIYAGDEITCDYRVMVMLDFRP